MSVTQIIRRGLSAAQAGLAALLLAGAAGPPPELSLPLACRIGEDCWVQNYMDDDPGPEVRDAQCGTRSYDGHNGTDIRLASLAAMRAGVAVLAAAPGTVTRVRDGVAERLVTTPAERAAIKGRECGNGVVIDHGNGWESQYCHMAMGSIAVAPGEAVARGAPLGRVGISGDTAFPHLHITLRAAGKPVDPLATGAAPGQCGGGRSLWASASGVAYVAGTVMAAGFTGAPPSLAAVMEAGAALPPPAPGEPVIAYVLAIGLAQGDVQHLALYGGDGRQLARNDAPPLDRGKAQQLLFAGRRGPVASARYWVERGGITVIEKSFRLPP